MNKIFSVAIREFQATVMTKGFIVGMLVTPVIVAVMVVVFPRLMRQTPPKVEGEIAVVDPTGEVASGVREYLRPARLAERRAQSARQVAEATPEAVRKMAGSSPQGQAAMQQSMDAALGEVPQLEVITIPPGADIEKEKAPLKTVPKGKARASQGRLALVIVHPDAVRRAQGRQRFGAYDLFVRGKLDDRIETEIRGAMRETIVEARVRASGLDRKEIEALTSVERVQSRTVTAEGERATNQVFNMLLPAGFMVLLLLSVLTSGQYLLTTTVEEKSNRVVEVLLSAVSAMELMVGKILGQMAVGLLVLALYAGLGITALFSFAMLGMLDLKLIFFLVIFYLLAYFTIASLMAAIGSAVNEIREAQTLMTPVMLIIMVPWMLWLPISRDPNSALATVLSFIPPVGNFVMLLRMTSTAPPPMWQAWVSIMIGAAGVYVALWFAAKVFRIGLLMFGKPPTLGTLIRWARMS